MGGVRVAVVKSKTPWEVRSVHYQSIASESSRILETTFSSVTFKEVFLLQRFREL